MSHYDNNPDDLVVDTQNFLKSEYGQYIMEIIAEKMEGHLSSAIQPQMARPDLPLGSFRGVKEIKELIESPLDDNTPSHG